MDYFSNCLHKSRIIIILAENIQSMKLPIINLRTISSVIIVASIYSSSASSQQISAELQEPPSISWQILPNNLNRDITRMRFTINGADSIARLCFTQLPRPMRTVSEKDSLTEINAGYYYLTSPLFGTSEKDIEIDVEYDWALRSTSEFPESFHAVTPGGRILPVAIHNTQSLNSAVISDKDWMEWMIPSDSIYILNEKLAQGKKPGVYDIVPSFKNVSLTDGFFTKGLPIETVIIEHSNLEYYRISLSPEKAVIEGASDKAISMGCRMLERRLLYSDNDSLPCAIIEDWPDYPYRGLMIDIARNFQSPETLREIVDLMADYRFNRLHFHITDDEAWRLEIPGLPELTEVGSRRGYTIDSHEYLPEIFAGTGFPDDNLPTASGFLSRRQFVDFIQYCDSLGIHVIPEIESPGHARAALMAMEARFRNTGDDTYRLIEDGDTSYYSTAQFYHDNLMNPALPATYRFIGKVVDEIAAMYKEADVPLLGIHLGGDEVPQEAWKDSPAAKLMSEKSGINGQHALQGEYVRNVARMMHERGIPLYGWQDICTDYDEAFHEEVAPSIGGMDCWVSPHDLESNIAVKGVKAGYPVIISNVDYFYMDMLYFKHPEEKGLFWGGIVDELRSLSGYPSEICPTGPDTKGKVIGVSGKLFAETIRNKDDMQRLLFPKCLGLAERGWNGTPTYSNSDFNMLMAEKELPRLSKLGVNWHLRHPGIKIIDGKIHMNSPYPGAEIHYTLDGTDPALYGSSIYYEPIDIPDEECIVKAILVKDGKTSVKAIVNTNENNCK